MYAGARRVVASLWQVDDQATAQLMTRFYRHMLAGGERPAAALRAAQLELAADPRFSAPYFWAGFVHPGRLALADPPNSPATSVPQAAGPYASGASEVEHIVSRAMAVPWELTASALDRLLVRLDPDPSRAADAYEALRLSLTRFFDWRGAHFPDECADETMNRLARRLDEGAAVADIRSFALGIARLVLLEQARSPQVAAGRAGRAADRAGARRRSRPGAAPARCLENVPGVAAGGRAHAHPRYYQDQRRQKIDRRLRLATQLGLSANALRSRAQRVRDRLERCVRACAAGRADDTKPDTAHFSRGDAAGDRRHAAALRQTDDAP